MERPDCSSEFFWFPIASVIVTRTMTCYAMTVAIVADGTYVEGFQNLT